MNLDALDLAVGMSVVRERASAAGRTWEAARDLEDTELEARVLNRSGETIRLRAFL
jgi:hypothetical protein